MTASPPHYPVSAVFAGSVAVLDVDDGPAGRQLVAGVCRAAAELGIPVVLVPIGEAGRPGLPVPSRLGDELVVGLIVIGGRAGRSAVPEHLRTLPTVVVNGVDTDPDFAQVRLDYQSSIAHLVRYVQDLGHRRIGYLGRNGDLELPDPWRRALARELIRADLFEPELFVVETADAAGGRAGGLRLLGLAERPTVVVCRNGRMAMGVYRAAAEERLPVPLDLSVVAVDDADAAPDDLWPSLDALHTPYLEMGVRAVPLLIDLTRGGAVRTVELECDLVRRSSTVQLGSADPTH